MLGSDEVELVFVLFSLTFALSDFRFLLSPLSPSPDSGSELVSEKDLTLRLGGRLKNHIVTSAVICFSESNVEYEAVC